MRATSPSRTAEAVCFMRATDQRRPPERRTVDDPYAERFLSPASRVALRAVDAAGEPGERLEARTRKGVLAYVLARHRYIDDALLAALGAGIRQVLILGAGYDTRAWRFADALAGAVVFEVDHPATAARKARLAAALPVVTRRVTVDFETQDLTGRLLDAGFDAGAATFVAWEGVSMYLTRAAVGATLDALHDLTGPGSTIAMDWLRVADGPGIAAVLERLGPRMLALIGEPARLYLTPAESTALVAHHGWRVTDIADTPELEALLRDPRRITGAMYVSSLVRRDR